MWHFLPSARDLSLQQKFFFAIASVFIVFVLLTSSLVYFQFRHELINKSYEKTNLLMAEVRAARKYVKDILRPKMYAILPRDVFIVEAMSTSFVSRNVMDDVASMFKQMLYKRASLNPRTPSNRADLFEKKMITDYNRSHSVKEWQGIIKRDDRSWFVTLQPVYTEKSCLRCHGNPEDAPADLLRRYGNQAGFYRKVGQVAGLEVVAIPVDRALAQIHRIFFFILGAGIFSLLFLFLLVGAFFEKFVHHPLKNLSSFCKSVAQGEKSLNDPVKMDSHDEIGEVALSFYELMAHLQETQQELKSHSEGLESLVKQRTRELNQNRKFLETVIATAPIGFLIIDDTQRVTFWNSAAAQITGISSERVIGRKLSEVDLPIPVDIQSIKPKHLHMFEHHFTSTAGQVVHVLINSAVLPTEQTASFSLVVNFIDISEMKLLHDELNHYTMELESLIDEKVSRLRESELRYRELFENANDAIVFLDSKTLQIIDANPRWLKLSGTQRHEINGRPFSQFLIPRNGSSAEKCLEKSHSAACTLEMVTHGKDKIFVELISSSFSMNNTSYVMSIIRDTTRRKKLEEKIIRTNFELKKRNRALRDLTIRLSQVEENTRRKFAGVLHDQLGQDLAAIKINIGMLAKQMQERHDTLHRDLGNIQKLLDKVISITRDLTSEMYPTILDNLGLVAAIKWYLENYSKKFHITGSLEEDGNVQRLLLPVEALLFRLIQEALLNCAKHAQATHVTIVIKAAASGMEIEIRDNGCGFEPGRFDDLEYNGNMGLHIIRERMDYLGGAVTISSQPGGGTSVKLTLPLNKPGAEHVDPYSHKTATG
ncbi:MAG: hypothetical protein DSY90_10705 [Deltaproteobacteria bacterium]|nr:MAG: hypothetical protein DSY90_10705 [Deltaproteobacteria bacterium]